MNSPKILVAVDFDHTLVDGNTDVRIASLASNNSIPDEIIELKHKKHGWTQFMRELFKFLHRNNVTRGDYIRCLSELPLVEGMKELLMEMHESGDCDIIILSDANMFFIEYILEEHGLDQVVCDIFTNAAKFDEDGCLQIKEFDDQDSCSRCERNMCKGAILENYIEQKKSENVHFFRILYVGDGHNDVCPSLRLSAKDIIFARKGYRLLRSLEKMPAKNVKATIHAWENGFDIRNTILSPQ